jgi:hypothetical protein
VTSRSWIEQFDLAAVSGQAKSSISSSHPINAWREFTAWHVVLILRPLFKLLKEFLVLFLAGTQCHSPLHGL